MSDFLTGCKGKISDQMISFYQTAITWIVGREYIRQFGSGMAPGSLSTWDSTMQSVFATIKGGASAPTAAQQTAMKNTLGSDGVAYTNTVMASILSASTPVSPGVNPDTCGVDWKTFACFCAWFASMYSTDPTGASAGGGFPAAVAGTNWTSYACTQDVQNDSVYSGTVVPTTAAPPDGTGTGGTKIGYLPSTTTTTGSWTPWIIGGVGVVLLGVAGAVAYHHSHYYPARRRTT